MDKLVTLVLTERLKNSNFILESKMMELIKIKKNKTIKSTRCCVKTLFYLGNKSIAHSTQLLTCVPQN